MPAGSQLLGIEAPDHDPTAILFFWAFPCSEDRPKIRSKFLVVEEDQPFTVEECSGVVELEDGTVYEEVHVHIEKVGFWTELDKEDGSFKTMHVLEIIDDDDGVAESETKSENEGESDDPG